MVFFYKAFPLRNLMYFHDYVSGLMFGHLFEFKLGAIAVNIL